MLVIRLNLDENPDTRPTAEPVDLQGGKVVVAVDLDPSDPYTIRVYMTSLQAGALAEQLNTAGFQARRLAVEWSLANPDAVDEDEEVP
jgi:hypothetical protein